MLWRVHWDTKTTKSGENASWVHFFGAWVSARRRTAQLDAAAEEDEEDDDDDDDGEIIVAMRASDVFLTVLAPLLGSLLAQVMFLSPLPKIQALRKTQGIESGIGELNPLPYPFAAANCAAWLMYGAISGNYWVYVPNGTGFLISLYYTGAVYGLDARWRERMERLMGVLVVLLLFVGMIVSCVLRDSSENVKLTVTGSVCNAILVVYYSAPLSTVAEVVRTRDSKSFYFPLTFMNGVNGLCWFGYGLALGDWFIAAPNLFGSVLSAVQMVLIFMYPSSKRSSMTTATSSEGLVSMVSPL